MRLQGPWVDGYVLERQHTLSSAFLGHDSFGNPKFDTKRTELGELVFQLKNRSDKNTLDSIADTAVQFIEGWNPGIEVIVPMPPSRKRTTFQPVVEIDLALGTWLAKPVDTSVVTKIEGHARVEGRIRRSGAFHGAPRSISGQLAKPSVTGCRAGPWGSSRSRGPSIAA